MEDFGTVELHGALYFLTCKPWKENYNTTDIVLYYATAVDEAGKKHRVMWNTEEDNVTYDVQKPASAVSINQLPLH